MFEYLIEDSFVKKEDRIAVGVSGGADSMLLLWALLDKQKQTGFYLEVININHHIREKSSDDDSLFVENFCKKRKIPYKIIDIDVKKLKNDKKYTLEESARVARYDAFYKVMKEDKLNKLFLAHHKNDQAETILMHIFRGAGIAGAVGIKNTDKIFRPLLNLTKQEILDIAKEHGVDYVQDETNLDNDYSRNYIRNVIIPQVEKVYPTVVNNITQFGKRCEEMHSFLMSLVDDNLIPKENNQVLINDLVFSKEKVLIREYIKKAFEKLGVFSDVEAKHFQMIYELSKFDVNKEISLPHGVTAKKVYTGVKLFKCEKKQNNTSEFEFVKAGEIEFGDYKIKTQLVKTDEIVYGDGLYLDSSKILAKAVWRTRRPGDKFSKIGTGSKKFNDYLTNNKVDQDLRDKLPILVAGENVLVVLGDDISEKVKIDGNTDEIVKITFERIRNS